MGTETKKPENNAIDSNVLLNEEEDICGICGEKGADKMALWTGGGVYWPGEFVPETEFVHQDCEQEETQRAFNALTPDQRRI